MREEKEFEFDPRDLRPLQLDFLVSHLTVVCVSDALKRLSVIFSPFNDTEWKT